MIAHNLNPRQQEAVESSPGPLLIIAGAGSGKTKTLTARLAYLLASGTAPEHVVAITFTNKAADEMRERVANNIRMSKYVNTEDGPRPFIGTFHSLGAKILRKEAGHCGRNPNYTIYDADDSLSVIKRVLKGINISKYRNIKWGPALFRYYISKIKNELDGPKKILEDSNQIEVVRAVYESYENELRKNNAFDFDDLIEKPVKLWQENPAILRKYRERFKYILVDEFQDVNTSQYEFIKLLAKEHQNINVVGDDGQAIYGFRFANFRHFLNFEKDWPDAKIVLLEENYRSTGAILAAANAIIKNNKLQKTKNLWTKNEKGLPIYVIEHEDEVAEAEWIASEISDFRSDIANAEFQTSALRPKNQQLKIENHKSIAVLYRTNAQSRALETALIERDIPYQIFGSIRFYERKEIKDIVACLRYALNPKDAVSLERMEKSLYAKPFRELRIELPQKSALPPYELVAYCLTTSKYFDYLKANFLNAEERIENLNELIGFAENYSNLNEFLEKITLLQSSDNENTKNVAGGNVGMPSSRGRPALSSKKHLNTEPVRLMTIHIAKGLEFDKVYVVGVNEGLLPHQMSYGAQEETEEERRLMYVAITRAKQELALSFYNIGSRFLYEIPPELIKFESANTNVTELTDNEERFITFD